MLGVPVALAIIGGLPERFVPLNRIGRERGWAPLTREHYEAGSALRGAYVVGSPEQVVEEILFQHELFGHDRFLLQLTVGPMPHASTLRAIELLGTEVAPAVRAEVSRRARAA